MTAQTGDGIPGFSDRDLPLVAGSLTGVRLWHVDMPAAEAVMNGAPARVEGLLTGVFGGTWQRGENVAVCGGGQRPPAGHPDPVPAHRCGCGFWAYWTPRDARRSDYYWRGDVIGVMQGYGRTRIGTRGCRCSKARILALHVRQVTPGVVTPGFPAWDLPHAEIAGILGSYYGVPCYPSLEEMLAACPPTTDYLPRRRQPRAASPAPPARPGPVHWLRAAGLAAAYTTLAGAVIMLAALWGPRAVAVVTAITVAGAIWPVGTWWLPSWARK